MAEAEAAKETVKRLGTGVRGLDAVLLGGIPEGDQVLVSGPPGTGKTIFGLQFVCEGARQGENGVFVCLDVGTPDYLLSQAKGLDLGLDEAVSNGKARLLEADPLDLYKMVDEVKHAVKETKARRLVFDSISMAAIYASSYKNLPEDLVTFLQETKHAPPVAMGENVQRQMIYYILREMRGFGCTSVFTSELSRTPEWYSRDTISEFACDGLILLDQHTLGDENIRTLQVVKMRRSGFKEGIFRIAFGKGGLSLQGAERR